MGNANVLEQAIAKAEQHGVDTTRARARLEELAGAIPGVPKPTGEPTADDRELMEWAKANPGATKVDRGDDQITDVGAYALAHQPGVDRVRIAATSRPRPAAWDSR